MFSLTIFVISNIVFLIFLIVMFLLSDLSYFLKEKILPFECGIENFKKVRIPLSLQFFFLTIIFVLFDMEIIFLIHFLFFFNTFFFSAFFMFFTSFVIFLFITLLIEWKWDSLNWIF